MTSHGRNLMLAAKLIRRLDALEGMSDFEGSTLSDIAHDVSLAARNAHAQALVDEALHSVKVTSNVRAAEAGRVSPETLELAARYLRQFAAIERAEALGDLEEVCFQLRAVDPVALREVADLLSGASNQPSLFLDARCAR